MLHKINLNYAYHALEPIVDKETMKIHYENHYGNYVKKLNEALNDLPEHKNLNIYELLSNTQNINAKYKDQIINNGGGVLNHNLYWEILEPGGNNQPKANLSKKINKDFGSFKTFKTQMIEEGKNRFGSGWVWMVYTNNSLKICSTINQNNPIMGQKIAGCSGIPLLGIDLWEHAYYLKYKNKRDDYLNKIWDIINFDKIEEMFDIISD